MWGRFATSGTGTRGTFDESIPFTRESWRGRIRACRGVGATLDAEQVAAFDGEHEALLSRVTDDTFQVLHRIDAHVLRPSEVAGEIVASGRRSQSHVTAKN